MSNPTNDKQLEELRGQIKNCRLINETPVGTKLFPEDIDMRLHNLLTEKDIDSLMQLILANRERYAAEKVREARRESYELLYWQYKELNHQSVDTKFVDAYNILMDELKEQTNPNQGDKSE